MSFDRASFVGEARQAIEACVDRQALMVARIKYLGRKGFLQELMSRIPTLVPAERRGYGAEVNAAKKEIEDILLAKEAGLSVGLSADDGFVDSSLPGKKPLCGRRHPLTQVKSQICSIFGDLGFKIFEGPEIETEFYNFEALNILLNHPSRDAFDTFYIQAAGSRQQATGNCQEPRVKSQEHLLLRSHTSPAQIRALETYKPPMAVVVPGRVYRPDAVDASHSFMFHQVEGIAVDENMRFSDLKGVLIAFARQMFGSKTKLRFRPSFFPFTEPSAEVDVSCFICGSQGCSVCKKSGWLEILGCGMVHPHVLKSSNLDPKRWRGFAFGMGVERIAMLKYGINDIRLFFENDIRFLEQF